MQRLAADKGELLQQHADEVDQYERRIRSLTEEVSLSHVNTVHGCCFVLSVYGIPLPVSFMSIYFRVLCV